MSRIETIGNCTLYLGDCREILPLLPKVDLVLTDPPYGIGAYKTGTMGGGVLAKQSHYDATEWDNSPPADWLIEQVRDKAKYQVFFGGNYFNLPPSKCWLVWDKDNGANNFADCELAWTNFPQAVRMIRWKWQGMLQQDMANKEERQHPTQKPVPVMQWVLKQRDDIVTVCDPFMGSGTTGVACANMGKTFYGIERELKYFDIACKRIEQAYAQQRLFA